MQCNRNQMYKSTAYIIFKIHILPYKKNLIKNYTNVYRCNSLHNYNQKYQKYLFLIWT